MAIQKLDRLSKDRSRAALRNDGVVDRECYLADCSAMVKMLTTPETLAEDESMRSNSSTLPRSVATRAPSPPVTLLLIQENAKTYRKGLSIRHLRHQMWERKDGHDDPADGQCKYHDDTNNADPSIWTTSTRERTLASRPITFEQTKERTEDAIVLVATPEPSQRIGCPETCSGGARCWRRAARRQRMGELHAIPDLQVVSIMLQGLLAKQHHCTSL